MHGRINCSSKLDFEQSNTTKTAKLIRSQYFNCCSRQPEKPVGSSSWAPSQYSKIRLSVRSRKVSKPRDLYFKLSYRFEIWQAHRQHCCRSACQFSERSDNSKYKSRGFETLRDLTERRIFGYWDGAQVAWKVHISRRQPRSVQERLDIMRHN